MTRRAEETGPSRTQVRLWRWGKWRGVPGVVLIPTPCPLPAPGRRERVRRGGRAECPTEETRRDRGGVQETRPDKRGG
jgi:hypothetical protein